MLALAASLLEAVIAHCQASHPIEACGVLAGTPGGTPTRHIHMANVLGASDRYAFDPAEQLQIWAELDRRGEDPLVIYHSHPRGPARPSEVDIRYAEPDSLHLIVSLAGGEPVAAAWRITDGQPAEVPLHIRG